jgi:hypothetical protein
MEMKKKSKSKAAWEKEVMQKLNNLEQYLDGPYGTMHEYCPDDVEFANKLEGLREVVSALYKATFRGEVAVERKEVCCVCGCALPETSLYFMIAEHEKAICKNCVSEMCPTYLSERGICLE